MKKKHHVDETNKLLTPEQAADLLQVSKRTIYDWLRNGEIPSERIGERLIRVREKDILSPDARTFFEQGCKLAQDPKTVERAAEFFNKAIALNPRYFLAYFELGRMYYVWSHYYKAIDPLKKAIEINPSFPAYMNLGMNCNKGGMHDEAKEALRKAVEIAPNSAVAHHELGFSIMITSFNDKERQREAADHFHKALIIQPSYNQSAYHLGVTLALHLNDYDRALSFADEIEETFPEIANHVRLLVKLNRK